MKSIKLSIILTAVAQLAGVSSRQISPEQHAAMVVAVSEALKTVWNEYPWPELCSTAGYYLWPDKYVAASSREYAAGAIVRFGESYWRVRKPIADAQADVGEVTVGTVAGVNNPATNYFAIGFNGTPDAQVGDIFYNPADGAQTTELLEILDSEYIVATAWSLGAGSVLKRAVRPAESAAYFETAVIDTYIPMPATAGKVVNAWDSDPNITGSYASSILFELAGDKVRIPAGIPRAWLETVAAEVELDGTYWVATESATVGMVRYSAAGGDCFKCIQAKEGNAANARPEADSAYWERVQIPALLAPPTKYLASAELLRADGKETTALARERRAEDMLESALQSVNGHQHQTARFRVRRTS